jgi:dUTP pyrophosphatase
MLIELPIGRRQVDDQMVLDTALFNTERIVLIQPDYENQIWEYGRDPRSDGLVTMLYDGANGIETYTIYLSLTDVMEILSPEASDEPLQIRINTHGNPMPEKHGAFYDLATAEDISLKAGESRLVSLGISIQLPKGYYTIVVSRSSTFNRYGLILSNGIGIIDNEYCGDGDIIHFPAMATEDIYIPKGTRIAQMTFLKELPAVMDKVAFLGNPDRGGFGSTGD